MPATILNAIVEQGADWEDWVIVTDEATNAAVSLAGFSAHLQARASYDDTSPVVSITTTSTTAGKIDMGGSLPTGVVRWKVAGATTQGFESPGKLYWDLLLVSPDGSRIMPVRGEITVNPGATRL